MDIGLLAAAVALICAAWLSPGWFHNGASDIYRLHLCSAIEGLRACHRRRRIRRLLIMTLLFLLITLIFCIVGYSLVLRSKLSRRLPLTLKAFFHYVEEPRDEVKYPRISSKQLVDDTGGLCESSLIGSGRFRRFYKGILGNNTRITLKVLQNCLKAKNLIRRSVKNLKAKNLGSFNNLKAKNLGSFKTECQVLKRIRHRNLIRIITTCSRPDFKAIVLPLMPNGSLEDHLYSSYGSSWKHGLDLIQLVSIKWSLPSNDYDNEGEPSKARIKEDHENEEAAKGSLPSKD